MGIPEKLQEIEDLRRKGYNVELLCHMTTGTQVLAVWKASPGEPVDARRIEFSVYEVAHMIVPNPGDAMVDQIRNGLTAKGKNPTRKAVGDMFRWLAYGELKDEE